MIIQLTLQFRTISPLFLGGAEQQAELRAPSLKGALRFWYRAVDPAYAEPDRPDRPPVESDFGSRLPLREDLRFGGTSNGAGQAEMLIRIDEIPSYQPFRWDRRRVSRFATGRGRTPTNGLAYLGYPFGLPGNEERTAIPPDTTFTVRCVIPRPPHRSEHRRGILAAWWLLGTFGSLGTRSRLGFGSLALLDWHVEPFEAGNSPALTDGWREDLALLPATGHTADPATWTSRVHSGLAACYDWLGRFPEGARHPNLGRDFQWKLLESESAGKATWEETLQYAGGLLQVFRQSYEQDQRPIRDYLRQGERLRQTPDRATFGLPLAFRFPSLPRGRNMLTIVPSGARLDRPDFERHASLLLLKLIPLSQGIYPLFVRMAGAVPGIEPPGTVRSPRRGIPLQPPRSNAMDAFFASLRNQ